MKKNNVINIASALVMSASMIVATGAQGRDII